MATTLTSVPAASPTGARASEPAAPGRLAGRDFLLILVELGLVAALVRQFHLEESHRLIQVVLLAIGGFAAHAWLAERWRPLCFLTVSLLAAVLVLGAEGALAVVATGAVLVAVALSPLPRLWRLGLLAAIAAACVWLRQGSTAPFWTVVGSMFMFRLIVYCYSIRHEPTSRSPLQVCSYFFLWPNIYFPLFPVVDFKTFCDTYFNAEHRNIYQSGVHWIAVGVCHLLLYRLIRSELLPEPLAIRSGIGLVTFLILNYALYVRVSGQFHVICGVLHLFGFNLPRTHDHYFLAASFSDIWRRINIYWKDFLTKLFFLPAFFRLRRLGTPAAMTGAVLWTFLWTWLGHSWQAFWLLGDFPFRLEDALLWLGVGVVVAMSALFEYRSARGGPKPRAPTLLQAVIHPIRVLAVLISVSVFWAWWSNPEIVRMLIATRSLIQVTSVDLAWLGGVIALALAAGFARWLWTQKALAAGSHSSHENPAIPGGRAQPLPRLPRPRSFEQSVAWHAMPMTLLLLLTQPQLASTFGPRVAGVIEGLRADRLTEAEAIGLVDGYYEQLHHATRQSAPLLDTPGPTRLRRAVDFSDMIRYRNDLLHHELIPGWKGAWLDSTITINRWGMRDVERSLVKPPGVVRVALIGSSFVMGFGVDDDKTFCRLLEAQLNAGSDGSPVVNGHVRYEVLNFGVGRYYPIHRRLQIEKKALTFQPDLIVYVAHQDEWYSSAPFIATAVYRNVPLEDPALDELVERIDIPADASEPIHHSLIAGRHSEILTCIYRKVRDACVQAHVPIRYAYLPVPGQRQPPFDPGISLALARAEGIETIDLAGWWGEHSASEILIGAVDIHPNNRGHQLLAEALLPVITAALSGR